jgi:antirestriction protein ArdC
MASNVYEKVFAKVVEAMEQGTAPWIKPWQGGLSMPYNAVTGRQYSGGNVLALWAAGMPYGSNGWLTFKQAIAEGCVVREGEKGTPVFFMSQATKKTPEDDEEAKGRYFFAKGFTVFNVEQLADLEEGAVAKLRAKHETAAPVSQFERIEEAERVAKATGASVQHGGPSACYIPSLDVIRMPEADKFSTADGYYSTLFHELAHWTGHETRLKRLTPARFGSPDYAFEELVAELGAAFVCGSLGIENVGQSAAYFKNWAKACREMPDLLPRAASYANKAAAYVMGEQSAPVTFVSA